MLKSVSKMAAFVKSGRGHGLRLLGSFSLAFVCALAGILTSAQAEDVSGTVNIAPGTDNSTNYNFVGNAGTVNVSTTNAHVYLRGTFTTAAGGSGTINVTGNKGQGNTGPALWLYKDFSGFSGTVTIGNAASSQLARDWIVFNENAKGSENARWVFNTGTNSGILLNVGPVKFGSLSGSGIVRGSTGVTVGALTTASDVDVFDGLFTQMLGGGSNYTVEKTGAGTWIWTGNIIPDLTAFNTGGVYDSNQIGTLKVTGGTLQIGDYGHVYTEGNLYYAAGATGDGVLGKGVAGTGTATVDKLLSLQYHKNGTELADSNPIQVTNATLAFGLAKNSDNSDTEIANAMTLTNGTISNVNPNSTVALTGKLTGSLVAGGGNVKITGAENAITSYTAAAGTLIIDPAANFSTAASTEITIGSGTIQLPAGKTYNNPISFTAADGVLDISTSTGAAGDAVADVRLAGQVSSTAAGYGTIFLHGNKGKSNTSKALLVGDFLKDFKGTVHIGESVHNEASRDWLVIDGTGTGSSSATFDLHTGSADSGILLRTTSPVDFGSLTGNGRVRLDNVNRAVSVGALLANETDTAVFHGSFTRNGNMGAFDFTKVGAGTLILSGRGGHGANLFRTVNVTEGTLQFGDLGHTYGANDMIYNEGAQGTGAGTLINNMLPTSVNQEEGGQPVNVRTNVTIAEGARVNFALASDSESGADFNFTTGGSIANLNPNTTITLSGWHTGKAILETGRFYLKNGYSEAAGTSTTINDGATFVVGNNTYLRLFPITVNEGGTLEFTADRTGGCSAALTFEEGSQLVSLASDLVINQSVAGTGVTVKGGTINFTSSNNTLKKWDIDQGKVVFGENVSLTNATSFDLASGTAIQIKREHTIGGGNPVTATFTMDNATIQADKNVTVTGKATGSFIKTGEGILAFNNNQNSVTKVTAKEGTVQISQATQPYITVVLDGGQYAAPGSQNINIEGTENGGVLNYNPTSYIQSLKNAQGVETAEITLNHNEAQGQIMHGLNMGGNLDSINPGFAKDFNGTINVTGYSIVSFGLEKDNGTIINSDYTDITMNLNTPDDAYSGIYLARPGLKAQLGDICGDGLVMTGVDGRTGTFTIQVGDKVPAGETSTFTGAFADKANNQAGTSVLNVEKVGDGTWVWGESTKNASNIDNYVTNLTVSDGELVLARKSGLSSAKNVTVAGDATLTIANSGQEIASSLTLNPNSTLQFMLSSDPLDSGRLSVPAITLDSSSNVAFSYDSDFLANIEEGLTLPLMNIENENALFTTKITNALASDVTLSNYFSLVQDGLSFALVAEGSYSGVPEPSAWLLLLLGLPFLRRRK